jgi:hypothetical protein
VSGEAVEGVYVLANDAVLPWTRSFVRSFRRHSPDLRLCLIPFDDSSAACRELVTAAGGTVLEDADAFRRLECIGAALELGYSTYSPHWFRRYVAFQGPFERFLYLDTRMVVLTDLRPILRALTTANIDLIHFDSSLNQVYRQGPLRTEFVCRGGGHGFFSGMWATRRGLFTMAHMEAAGTELVAVREQMNNRNTDQFFINYLCDTHRVRMAHYADLNEHVAHVCWAGDGHRVYRVAGGDWRKWAFGQPDHQRMVPFVHWGGFRLSPAMPNYHLFDRFQCARYSFFQRVRSVTRGLPGRVLYRLRSLRWLNTLYHALRPRRHHDRFGN